MGIPSDSDMEIEEDTVDLPASSRTGCGNNDNQDSCCEPRKVDSLPQCSEVEEVERGISASVIGFSDGDSKVLLTTGSEKQLVDNTLASEASVQLTETVGVTKEVFIHSQNGSVTIEEQSILSNNKEDGLLLSNTQNDASPAFSLKTPEMIIEEKQPSVLVTYSFLTRDSKQKLEELLKQWSQWHAQNCSASRGSNEVLESGERTYFPALHVGLDKPSAVSFWIDNQTRKRSSKDEIPLDGDSVPLYDRGYTLALTSFGDSSNLDGGAEVADASRCFNCGSYNHSLKDCPKPRDNVAVNNARKQHKSRRNQNPGSRNLTRYYENTPGGKYDGLRPGVLDAETRKLLGLGELDPPPWLNRMREIGYPPGYLDLEDGDQPSGITIFADEESKPETEEGEILDTSNPGNPDPPKKMIVEFPGLNAPIPENADERRWTDGSSSSNASRNRPYRRYNHSSEQGRSRYHEQRLPRDYEDDGPPGCDPGTSPSLSGYFHRYGSSDHGHGDSYSHRYGSSDPGYSYLGPRSSSFGPRSPTYGRSLSERGSYYYSSFR